jgi:trehalose 6-phosphate synthase/phosphatase
MTLAASRRIKRIVLVSYRLPFREVENGGGKVIEQNAGGLVSAISALSEKQSGEEGSELFKKILWVGKGEFSAGEKAPVSGDCQKIKAIPGTASKPACTN